MLFLFLLSIALLKGALLFLAGFLLALGLWVLGRACGLRLPAWLRWGAAAVVLAVAGQAWFGEYLSLDDAKAPARALQDGWPLLQFETERTCQQLAIFLLGMSGLAISCLRGFIGLFRRSPKTPPPIPT